MSDVIKLVQGDGKPNITLTLVDQTTGDPFDVSASSTVVRVKFRAAGTTTLLSTIICTKTDPTNGVVTFDFSGDVLDVDPGMYEGEIEVTLDSLTHTVYDVLKFRVRAEF